MKVSKLALAPLVTLILNDNETNRNFTTIFQSFTLVSFDCMTYFTQFFSLEISNSIFYSFLFCKLLIVIVIVIVCKKCNTCIRDTYKKINSRKRKFHIYFT